ncbi:MAG: hypothetical protein JJ863_12895 [Deltaproteobacteria bacterium]|nr:hypothetical protein [Deltaproteobacteria bacterium]
MRNDAYESIAPAEVRGHPIPRHGIGRYEGGRAFAVATGIGRPRGWSIARKHVLRGLGEGLANASSVSPAERLRTAVAAARGALIDACNALVERDVPDAGLVALLLSGGAAHVAVVGDGRVYLQRRGNPQRLTPRDQPAEGLIEGQVIVAETVLDPNDLLLIGSASAFSEAAISRVGGVLQSDAHAPPSALASLLTEPARKAGVGAAALAIRIA